MNWKCKSCGIEHRNLPTSFGMDAPWRDFVPEDEFDNRVELTKDQCVVDNKIFLVRGHIEILIHGHDLPLEFSVWASLSETSQRHMRLRWNARDRVDDAPYFGWLCNEIPIYRNTIQLKCSIQSRLPGEAPLVTVEPTDHPLAIDQRNGITIERWHQLAHLILHG